ncbi:hypothetical protein JD82_03859 [Prauserella rugosa]|uniref:Uncharacterized protein n=1 Tax=Prauserella rugosa TaxID=43354 RepID=A0A660CF75_9PSEU|nr:hypothetical protein JD82_03859 [Prauserella rugosa]
MACAPFYSVVVPLTRVLCRRYVDGVDRYEGIRKTVERVVGTAHDAAARDDVGDGDGDGNAGGRGSDAGADGADRVDVGELLGALESLRAVREELAAWEPELIAAARRRGVSWGELAPVLGVASRQAAERRYLRLRKAEGEGGTTADGRVQAERDRRAAERAVRHWAQANSELVRKLAAMVSAAGGHGIDDIASADGVHPDGGAERGADVDEAARHHIDVVYHRLGGADAADLLPPLVAAAPHLRVSHPDLAEQVEHLDAQAQQVRDEALDRRVGR